MKMGRPKAIALAVAAIVLGLAHQDLWFWRDSTLVFGFLPVGLAYHVSPIRSRRPSSCGCS
jgi:hypothetical protein